MQRGEGSEDWKDSSRADDLRSQHGSEHEGPGSGWRARARGHLGVGEWKEPDKVRGERVRDTRGSACANWLGGQGDLGSAHRQGTQKGGQWLSGGGEDYRR